MNDGQRYSTLWVYLASLCAACTQASRDPSNASFALAGQAQYSTPPTALAAGAGAAGAGAAGAAGTAGSSQRDLRCQADMRTPQRVDYARPGPFAVGTLELTFEDTTRPIVATDKHAAAPSRTLPTTIYYPSSARRLPLTAAAVADAKPFPLLMYSHGYSSSRDEAVPVAEQLASYGYIVVAPEFPLTNTFANGGAPDIEDTVNQPGDVSFLIDRVLALSATRTELLAGAVDETRIGALGVSLGGLTTLLVSYHPKLQDKRVQAALPIAAPSSFFAQGFYHTRQIPLLLLHGDLDAFINYEANARRTLTRAAPNVRLITVKKGTHAAFGAQLDPDTILLANGLIAPAGADPTNPDGLGCGAVGGALQMTGPAFLSSLGGPENFIEPDPNRAASVPCLGDEYKKPALDAREQSKVAVASVPAFFDAHFAKSPETRQDGCRYLLHELPKNPVVTIE